MEDPRTRQITIKTNVVKRLFKEKISYEKEAEQIVKKIDKMIEDGKDEYDIKKQGEVLQETRGMVPDCARRLKKAYEELEHFMAKESDMSETEEYLKAKEIIAEAKTCE